MDYEIVHKLTPEQEELENKKAELGASHFGRKIEEAGKQGQEKSN